MNQKKIIISLIAVIMLIFASCSSSNSNVRKNSFELTTFNGGDDGLTFEFLAEAPPSKVRDQGLQPFQVMFSVKNNGEFDIPENRAYVSLSGIRPQDLGLTETSKVIPALNGYKKQGDNVIEGRTQQIIFSNLRYLESVRSGSIPITLYANVCYPYETKAFTLVCINGNTIPSLDEKTRICDLDSDRDYANSGAPIHIEDVSQYSAGSSSIGVRFTIVHTPTSTVSNVYQSNSIDSNCNINGNSLGSTEALLARDKIRYVVETGLPGLNCGGTGTNTETVQLINNRYTVTCEQSTAGEGEYEKPVSITLNYDYVDKINTQILVE
ncbi:MAG: hypothetical protein KDD45_12795, partial [Bdellovibrionales bacterium]|nr:hypothetical protein [Bdellovibrionales bacterium]